MSGQGVVIDIAEAKRIGREAARYRWLREHFVQDIKHRLTWYLPMNFPMTAEGLDAHIDSMLRRGGSAVPESQGIEVPGSGTSNSGEVNDHS
jgi:hypothetical protein